MDEITYLQNRINILNGEINELQYQRAGLVGFQVEEINALETVEFQIEARNRAADKFASLSRVSTFANRLANKISAQYGIGNRRQLTMQYEDIYQNISSAIRGVDIEIYAKQQEVIQLQNRIAIIQEQIRQEQIRQEQLRQEQLRLERLKKE